MTHRLGLGMACLAIALAQTPDVEAQVRGKSYEGRRHSRPRRHARPAPTPPPTGPWTAARASFILSAESLLGVANIRRSATQTSDFQTRTQTSSGFSVHLFKGAEMLDPFGQARLGLDGVLGPGVTLGGSIGYATFEETVGRTTNTTSGFVVVPRLGYMLGPSRYLGIWLRAGIGYARLKLNNGGESVTQRAVDLVVDPMLVVTPLPHVGLTMGPSLNVGLGGDLRSNAPNLDVDATSSSYGLSAGLALLF